MTSEYLTLTLQDLETLLSKSGCGCHFINPNKTRLILWKEVQNGTEIYYLRIGVQKFISYPLKDKNKLDYWKFNSYGIRLEVQSEPSKKEITSDLITKFQQRQAKAINYGKSDNNEQSVDNPFSN